jgi:uncharacterized membrane protein
MDAILLEWGALLLRWVHIITGIAWIGSSFYFMHIDAALRPKPNMPEGAYGEVWEVHGGGFYEVRKYLVAPPTLPQQLIWHKWESYFSWLSGFLLLIWVYYLRADLFLIDPAVMSLSTPVAALIGVGSLVIGWFVYDFLCKSPIGKNDVMLAGVGFVYVVGMACFFQHVFSARGAFIHTGALMATIMSANVFLIIIPNQNKVIASLMAGQAPDPKLGAIGKARSTHNNYLTLPVLFLMISNHYPITYSSPYAYLVVALVLIAGALVRVFYNLSHAGKGQHWWTWIVALMCIAGAIVITLLSSNAARDSLGLSPLPQAMELAGQNPPQEAPAAVVDVVISRCSMCHAAEPVWDGITTAPKGVHLDTPAQIQRNKSEIYMQAVLTRAMPPNNLTEITDQERRVLRDWLKSM